MNTINLARKLELGLRPPDIINQKINFLFVLDFEATCWEKYDINAQLNEIIEFSVVLYDLSLKKILSEYQQYVTPTECPKLSSFCTSLTGITQKQVDEGVKLDICLTQFQTWFRENLQKYDIIAHSITNKEKIKNGVFVTWSSWDLGTCLLEECERKNLHKPDIFNVWIDLRILYEEYYGRKRCARGLTVALRELGLSFVGNQHCGLDDARNTAYLAGSMRNAGVKFRVTNDILY